MKMKLWKLLEILNILGWYFTVGGSFSDAQSTHVGQAQKAIFELHKYLYKFTSISPEL